MAATKQAIATQDRLLTDVELELMHIIWSLNQATVKDVILHLPETRNLAYTTVATVLKVLEQKKFLVCQKDSYAHSFHPLVSKADYENTCIHHIVKNVFDDEPGALIQKLLSAKKFRKDEIQSIENALKKLTSSRKKI